MNASLAPRLHARQWSTVLVVAGRIMQTRAMKEGVVQHCEHASRQHHIEPDEGFRQRRRRQRLHVSYLSAMLSTASARG